ncbi:hypothetical protein [Rhizobium wuzhouense]|uniref:Uncharacterized protein n=1 Tax=Rhizobium wuzhouense TaxID=1986026 RepID=A0ABX5P267_9HYPH|nr:hypothetical protein [Rhizobium wuzhouense]PYB77876.1 hypothetical protein DMY87_00225 [Rhizobium wuzhouense]
MRSVVAASRAADREAQRRNKQRNKLQMIADSASAVEDWQAYFRDLVSVHTNLAEKIDWRKIAFQTISPEPLRSHVAENRARKKLEEFRPGFFDFARGGTKRLRSKLERRLQEAIAQEQRDFDAEVAAHGQAVKEWQSDVNLAQQLLAGEPQAIRQVIEEMQTLDEEELIGTGVEFSIGKNFVHACPTVHGDEIVPKVRRSQSASGRLTETKMPAGQFHELYQDYVASVALKTAGDLFQILPLSEVYVTCKALLLNSATGHKDWTPILSVHFVRQTFTSLRLDAVDPSDAIANFRHAMKFSKSKGFSAVTPLEAV